VSLRVRISLALLLIAALLVAPAIYGLINLWELRQIAADLKSRDAQAILALGRLNAALQKVAHEQRIHAALGAEPSEGRTAAERRLGEAATRADASFGILASAGYEAESDEARRLWEETARVAAEARRRVEAGELAAAEELQRGTVDPAFAALDAALDPIGQAIDQAADLQVLRAGEIAAEAVRTTLAALAVAVVVALAVGYWLARSIGRPVDQLGRATRVVAAGAFDPDLTVSTRRHDELGELARSFTAMTTQLAELDRLKAEFVSVASHELKTPLSVIRGYVALLRRGTYGTPDEKTDRVLGRIDTQVDQLDRMIRRLLDVSRFEAGGGRLELTEIELAPFLAHFEEAFEALAVQNEIALDERLGPDLPETIVGDADRLNEVFGNLLSNAFKFTRPGGRITLSATRAEVAGGEGIEVAVVDTGVGIPEDKLPRVFEKFFQVGDGEQPRHAGSGLGLAIAKEIVDAHGGAIDVESRLGEGTKFRVLLPVRPPAHRPASD